MPAAVIENDSVSYEFPLPLRGYYCPNGIPLVVETNSSEILAALDPAWTRYPARRGAHPATLLVMVEGRNARIPVQPSMPIGRDHLVIMNHGRDNFAICDLSASFAFARLTEDVAADRFGVRYHFLDPAVYLMIEARHFCPVHASCISLNGRAILLCGDSGAGKTSLAYACAKQGWNYLAGDATYIVRNRPDPTVAGRPFSIRFRAEARELFSELSGWPLQRRPDGRLDLDIGTHELGLTVALESTASCVVFLNRQKGHVAANLAPFSPGEAFLRCCKVICYGDEQVRAAQKRALSGLMELPVAELTYSDFGGAERKLRELAARAL
jgi:hypothetical protein